MKKKKSSEAQIRLIMQSVNLLVVLFIITILGGIVYGLYQVPYLFKWLYAFVLIDAGEPFALFLAKKGYLVDYVSNVSQVVSLVIVFIYSVIFIVLLKLIYNIIGTHVNCVRLRTKGLVHEFMSKNKNKCWFASDVQKSLNLSFFESVFTISVLIDLVDEKVLFENKVPYKGTSSGVRITYQWMIDT